MNRWPPPPPGPPPPQNWNHSNVSNVPQTPSDYQQSSSQYGSQQGPAPPYQQGPPLPNRPQAYPSQSSYGSAPLLPPRPSSTTTSQPPIGSVPAGYQAEVLQNQHGWAQQAQYSAQPPSDKYNPHAASNIYPGRPSSTSGYQQNTESYHDRPSLPSKLGRYDTHGSVSGGYQQADNLGQGSYSDYGSQHSVGGDFSNSPSRPHPQYHPNSEQITSPFDDRPGSVPPWEQHNSTQHQLGQQPGYPQSQHGTPAQAHGAYAPPSDYSNTSASYGHQHQPSQSSNKPHRFSQYGVTGYSSLQQRQPESNGPSHSQLPGPPPGPPPPESSPNFSPAQPSNPYASGLSQQTPAPLYGQSQSRPPYSSTHDQYGRGDQSTASYNQPNPDTAHEPVSPLQRPSYDANAHAAGHSSSAVSGPPSRSESMYSKPVRSSPAQPAAKLSTTVTTTTLTGASALGFGGPSDWQYLGMGDDEVDDTAMYGAKTDDGEDHHRPTAAIEMPSMPSPTQDKTNPRGEQPASDHGSAKRAPAAQTSGSVEIAPSANQTEKRSQRTPSPAERHDLRPVLASSTLLNQQVGSAAPTLQEAAPVQASAQTSLIESGIRNQSSIESPAAPNAQQQGIAQAKAGMQQWLDSLLFEKDKVIADLEAKHTIRVNALEKDLSNLRAESLTAAQRQSSTDSQLAQIKKELEESTSSASALAAAFATEKQQLYIQSQQNQTELESTRASCDQLQKDLGSARIDHQTLQDEVTARQQELRKAEADSEAKDKEMEALKLQHERREQDFAALQTEQKQTQRELEGHKSDIRQRIQELEVLKHDHEQKQTEFAAAKSASEEKIQAQDKEKADLQTQLNETNAYFTQSKVELEGLKNEKTRQEEQIEAFRKELEEAKKAADFAPGLDPWFRGGLDRFKDALYTEAKAQQIQDKLKAFMDFVNAESRLRGIDPPFGSGAQPRAFNPAHANQIAESKKAGSARSKEVQTRHPPPIVTHGSNTSAGDAEEYSPGGRPIMGKPQEEDEYSPGGRPIIRGSRGSVSQTQLPDVSNQSRSSGPAVSTRAADPATPAATASNSTFQAYVPGTPGSLLPGASKKPSTQTDTETSPRRGDGRKQNTVSEVRGIVTEAPIPAVNVQSPVPPRSQQETFLPSQQLPISPSRDAPIPVHTIDATTLQQSRTRSRSPSSLGDSIAPQRQPQLPPSLVPKGQTPNDSPARQSSPTRAPPDSQSVGARQRQQSTSTRPGQGQVGALKALMPNLPFEEPAASPRTENIKKALTRYSPNDFTFIVETTKDWEAKAAIIRRDNEKARRARLEASEQRVNELFDAEEIGYGDIAELEDEAKEAEAKSQAEEEKMEYESYAKEVFDVVFRRLQDDMSVLMRMYTDGERCVTDAVAGQTWFTAPSTGGEAISLSDATALLLQVSSAVETRHSEIAKAVAERDKRYKRTQTKPLYARGEIAEMKKMERAFETSDRKTELRSAIEKVERCKRLWKAVDAATQRGLGDDSHYADQILRAAETVDHTAERDTLVAAKDSILPLLASFSKSLLSSFESVEAALNDTEYAVSVASSRFEAAQAGAPAGAQADALAKLKGEKEREDVRLKDDGAGRLKGVEEDLAEGVAVLERVLDGKGNPGGPKSGVVTARSADGAAGGDARASTGVVGEEDDKQRRLRLALEAAKRRNGDLS